MKGKDWQYELLEEAIRTANFVRNKALRYWMDNRGVSKNDLQKLCATLAKEYDWAGKLNFQARQSSADRAWNGISRFYKNCRESPMKNIKTRRAARLKEKPHWQQNPMPPDLKAALARKVTKQEVSMRKLMKRSEEFLRWARIGKNIKNLPDLPDCLKPH